MSSASRCRRRRRAAGLRPARTTPAAFRRPGSVSYSEKLVKGTRQRAAGPSQRRQCGEVTLRTLVTPGSVFRPLSAKTGRRHAPARESQFAALCAIAHDGCRIVRKDAGKRRQIARAVHHGARHLQDRRLPLGEAVEIAHAPVSFTPAYRRGSPPGRPSRREVPEVLFHAACGIGWRGPVDGLRDPFWLADADDGGGDARIAHGELQRGGTGRNAVPGADLLDPRHGRQHLGRCLLVDVARVRGRSLGQHAPRIGGGIEHGHAAGLGQVHHLGGIAVHQREAVVGDDRVEIPVAHQRHHDVHAARGKPHRIARAPLPSCGRVRPAHPAASAGSSAYSGIMQVEQLDAADVQRLEALLQRAPARAPHRSGWSRNRGRASWR